MAQFEGTRIYGNGDDCVESDGEYYGELSCYGTDDEKYGVFLRCNDGTEMEIRYGKIVNNEHMGIWGIRILKQGDLFDHIQFCTDENADIYSDIVFMKKGVSLIETKFKDDEWIKLD